MISILCSWDTIFISFLTFFITTGALSPNTSIPITDASALTTSTLLNKKNDSLPTTGASTLATSTLLNKKNDSRQTTVATTKSLITTTTTTTSKVIDGRYSQWTAWSLCSVTCGSGIRTRNRTCTDPPPKNGGRKCADSPSEIESCGNTCPPIHGGYSEWTHWTFCRKKESSRYRNCTNPAPAHGGANCTHLGDAVDKITNCTCQEDDIDYKGGDIKTIHDIPTWRSCSSRCRETDGCVAWVWTTRNYTIEDYRIVCNLKNHTKNRRTHVGVKSGLRVCGLKETVKLETRTILIASLSAWSILICIFILAAFLLKRKENATKQLLKNVKNGVSPGKKKKKTKKTNVQVANDIMEQEEPPFETPEERRQAVPLLKITEEPI